MFGQTSMVDGYGNSQYANQGRPVWITGNSPAWMTANTVIASEKRLIEVRHFCSMGRRIAEMEVTAWPKPTHQTKLMMSKAQPTGWLLIHSPIPLTKVSPMRPNNIKVPSPVSV